jgi:hypothetical protein
MGKISHKAERFGKSNRNSSSKNKQFGHKIFISTSQELAVDDGCLLFHLYRIAQ